MMKFSSVTPHTAPSKGVRLILSLLYVLLVVVMSTATIVEHYRGTPYVQEHIYDTGWFTAAWALLAAVGIYWMLASHIRKASVWFLHLSFVVILFGAGITHFTASRGVIHLREGEEVSTYTVNNAEGQAVAEHQLPFAVRLHRFSATFHAGTSAAMDFITRFDIIDEGKVIPAQVSMNKIYSYRGIRLYQASYDSDGYGSYLSVNADRAGITVTYLGYACLFIAMLWMLFNPKGAYRRVLRSPLLKKGGLLLLLMAAGLFKASALPVVPTSTANHFGDLLMNYNQRICPVQTFSVDFTRKLHGAASYKGYSADQILMSWLFFPKEWSEEPFIQVKSSALRDEFHLEKYTSVSSFFAMDGTYLLGPLLHEYREGNHDALHHAAYEMDDKISLVMSLREGAPLFLFPVMRTDTLSQDTPSAQPMTDSIQWYSPQSPIASNEIPYMDMLFIKNFFPIVYSQVLEGNYAKVDSLVGKLSKYQRKNGGASIPSNTRLWAEHIYNAVPFATLLFRVNLTLGLMALFLVLYRLTRKDEMTRWPRWAQVLNVCISVAMMLSFLLLTFGLVLRGIISGNVPMANGYETMLFIAWLVMLLALLLGHRFRILITFGLLLSGFFLLVSHIGQMDPQISHIMPVLNSPLLSIHVSIIMMSYALLSLTFICALTAFLLKVLSRAPQARKLMQAEALQALSQVFLYPALTLLAMGIFIGAIWANVSWGQYWGWDPKETWALITLLVYAVAVHTTTLPALKRPYVYHVFMALAFLTVLMTYFGVNYFLGGMHSYA